MLPRPRPAVQQDFQGKQFDRRGAKDATFNPQITQMAQMERGALCEKRESRAFLPGSLFSDGCPRYFSAAEISASLALSAWGILLPNCA
jgi:hypothetical protein